MRTSPSDVGIHGSIKSREKERGGKEAARRACWLMAAIYGSRHTRVYFCLPLSLETKTVRGEGRSVIYYVSYLQLFCLGGRQSMFIFALCLANVWAVTGSSAATAI